MGNLTKNTITRGAVVALALSAGAATTANAAVTRTAGADRFSTATEIFKAWPTTTTTAVLAAGVGHDVDALTVAPLAKMKNAPVILVDTKATTADIVAKFTAFTTVYIANGTGVVTPEVEAALKAAGKTVVRLGGLNRTETALNIAKQIGAANGIVVANGDDSHLVDTLSIASIAAAKGMPIFLTEGGSLSAAEATYAKSLGATNVYALGGATVVTDAAAAGLGTTVTRLAGAGRYETNAAVVTKFKADLDLSNIYVASGEDANLIDALAGAPLAGLKNAPIVFAHNSLNADVNTLLNNVLTPSTNVVVLGGTGAVSDSVVTSVTAIQNPVNKTLAVTSVTAINAKQFQVVFNKPVDDTTFASVGFTEQAPAAAPGTLTYDLSSDGMTLTVTTQNVLTQKGYYFASIVGVKDTDGNTINPYTTVVYLNDTVAPSVASTDGTTSSSSTRTFKLKFNEPSLVDLVKVGTVVASAVPDQYFKTYTITLPASADALTAGSSYAVTINGLRDVAGNYASTSSVATSVAIIQDTVKPVATVTPVSPVELKVVFSKDMSSTIPVDGITIKNASGAVLPLSGIPTLDSDNRTLHVKLFASPIATDKTSADLTVTVKNFADSVGNTIDSKDTVVTVTNDTVKPAMKSVRINPSNNTKVEVTLTEPVTGLAASDFVITRNGDTSSTPLTVDSISGLDGNNKVVLTLHSGLTSSDTYTVALKVDSVVDASGNKNAAQVSTFTYSAPAAAQITATITDTTDGATAVDSTSGNRQVYIQFNAADVVNGISNTTGNYKDGSATNPANYTLDGSALPKGTIVTFNDDVATGLAYDAVTLDLSGVASGDLPSEFANGGNAVVTISSVKNGAGSTVQYTSNQIAVLDKTLPTLSSAYLTGTSAGYTLTVVFSEKINAVTFGDFILTPSVGADITIDSGVLSSTDATKATFVIGTDKANLAAAIAAGRTFKLTLGAPSTTTESDLAAAPNQAIADAIGIVVYNYTH